MNTGGNGLAALAISTNGSEQSRTVPQPVRKRSRIQQRDQAATLKRFAYDSALALKQACTQADTGQIVMDVKTAVAVQKLIGAWDTAADRLRVLRGKGLPASERSKAKTAARPTPLEPA